ncbi:hypothetical protein FUAX_17280 [Fulvitalea axinellae]|uniref:DUF3667 domain-containing protein n=1 Tax=Fulvitalea axinellae TaxID=1182444 RepID=A0AAU9D8S4_9BACT|nr:hypothetical protein FUAX_17280 [Fulvitalea axinellae]
MICKNCENDFEGKFCNNCGQSSEVRKIDFKYLADELANSVFQINRGLFFTIKELFLKPGVTVREFLEGKRQRHSKPLAFLLLTSTLYVLGLLLVGKNTYHGELMEGVLSGFDRPEDASVIISFFHWLAKNHAYAMLLFLPVFSLASFWVFFRSEYNYLEHLILNVYITGEQSMIYLVGSLCVLVFDNYIMQLLPALVGIGYNFWAFKQFFKGGNAFTRMLLTVLTYSLFIILVGTGIFLVGMITVFLNS